MKSICQKFRLDMSKVQVWTTTKKSDAELLEKSSEESKVRRMTRRLLLCK